MVRISVYGFAQLGNYNSLCPKPLPNIELKGDYFS